MKLLITGGTGSFGKHFLASAVEHPEIDEIVIYSRDEWKQWQLECAYPKEKHPNIHFFIGDVRDEKRLTKACRDVDLVVHAAALKQVPIAEIHPLEYVKTNVWGAANLISACEEAGVRRCVALSTDKAAAPVNLYGATKLCSDKMFIAADNIAKGRVTNFSVVRYGNVMCSRGSVIPFFCDLVDGGAKEIPITDTRMTRFNINLDQAIALVWQAVETASGGEIFVPKIPSYRITDVARAIAPELPTKTIGIRPGEKLHEEMITATDACHTVDLGDRFAILPEKPAHYTLGSYATTHDAKSLPDNYSYSSGNNPQFMTIGELQEQIDRWVRPQPKGLTVVEGGQNNAVAGRR